MSFVFDQAPAEVLERDWLWLFASHLKARLVVDGAAPSSSFVDLADVAPGALVGPSMALTGKLPTSGIGWANPVTFYDVGAVSVGGVLVWLEPTGQLVYYGSLTPVTPGDRPLTVSWPTGLFRV